ncbi:MAG TPA: hypothetical protein VGX68_17465 [Thermoanaerobaculia bacterium]|jgi:hypothetical protein|nr:hypothetical protein [Thermoanaerobaculia bacterium]
MSVSWLGYDFDVYDPLTTTWNDVGGVYIFAGTNHQNEWAPLYIGQADSFHNRIPCHERWAEAALLGATHVHAMTVPQAANRARIEHELCLAYQPPLNTQLRSLAGFRRGA